MDLLGIMILGAIERDQHASAKAAEPVQSTVDPPELLDGFGEDRVQQVWGGWVEQIADVIVVGDFVDAEQAGAVGSAVALREVSLMRQKGWALHEEHRERRHADVAHSIGRVDASPLVRQSVQAAAQRFEQGLEQTHDSHESDFWVPANP